MVHPSNPANQYKDKNAPDGNGIWYMYFSLLIVGGTIDGRHLFAAQVIDKLINFAFIHTKSVKDRWEIADIVNCIFRTSGERECAAFDSSS